LEQGVDRRALSVADLQGQEPSGDEPARGPGGDAPDDVEPVDTPVKGLDRLVAYLGGEGGELPSRGVRRGGPHRVERGLAFDRGKQVAGPNLEPARRAQGGGVGPGNLRGGGGQFGGEHPGPRPLGGGGGAHPATSFTEVRGAGTRARGPSRARVTPTQPLPVPRSRSRTSRSRRMPWSTASTSSSVSGRGTSTRASPENARPQHSRAPVR